jgi:hypothetical protein
VSYSFPLDSARQFAERVAEVPGGARSRRCVLRDDSQQHAHAVVPLSDDPVLIQLFWKASTRGREQLVGLFRLHLAHLLSDGYVRYEGTSSATEVRLRFRRGDRGVIYIQAQDEGPALAIGTVDLAA